jgi:D-mannonate dehydratase
VIKWTEDVYPSLRRHMKLGVSHQDPEDLHEARFEFLRRLGVEAIEVRLRSQDASREKLEEIVEAVSGSGLELHEIMLEDLYNSTTSALNLPGRDEDIAFFNGFLKDLGELGIPHTTYAWHTGGMYETHRARTRGVATRGFSTSLADQAPLPIFLSLSVPASVPPMAPGIPPSST